MEYRMQGYYAYRPMAESYYTLKRVMQILRLSKNSVVKLIQHGWLSPVMRGQRLLFQPNQVAWVQEAIAQNIHPEDHSSLVNLDRLPDEHPWPVGKLSATVAQNYQVLPIHDHEGNLVIGCADPSSPGLKADLETLLGNKISLVRVEPEQIRHYLDKLYGASETRILKPVKDGAGKLRIKEKDRIAAEIQSRAEGVRRWYDDTDTSPRVFIAMPFHPSFDSVHQSIQEAIEHCGGRSLRVDQVPNLRNIWMAIENEIARCDVLLADFTGDVVDKVANPNVVTEATIAFHKYQKPVVICTQSTEALFFDWKHHFALVYENTKQGLVRLYQSLVGRLAAEFVHIESQSEKTEV